MPSYLDDATGKTITVNDVVYPDRKNLVIIGDAVSATDVPATNSTQLNIAGGGGGGAVSTVFGRIGDVAAANNDYTASQVAYVPDGALITATNVQGAITQAAQQGGEVNTLNPGSGTGESIVLPKVGAALYAKRVRGGANVNVSTVGDEIVIDGGASSPQSGVYGEFHTAITAATTLPAGVSTKLLGTTNVGQLRDFDDDGGVSNRLRYTGGFATKVAIELSCSFARTSAPGTARFQLQIVKNGTDILEGASWRDNADTNIGAMSTHAIADCEPGDYFEAWMVSSINTSVVAYQANMMITVSGGSVSGYDYTISNKEELIAAAASYIGGVITLQAGSYFIVDDIDLTESGSVVGDRIVCPSNCIVQGVDALRSKIRGNVPAVTGELIVGPTSGSFGIARVEVINSGDGACLQLLNDFTSLPVVERVRFLGIGDLVEVAGTGTVSLSQECDFGSGACGIHITNNAAAVVVRDGIYGNCTDAICVDNGVSVGTLDLDGVRIFGTPPTGSMLLNEGAIDKLQVRGCDVNGLYGIRNLGTVTAAEVFGNRFQMDAIANAIIGLTPSSQAYGETYSSFYALRNNTWENLAGTSHTLLDETRPIAGVISTGVSVSPSADVLKSAFLTYKLTAGGLTVTLPDPATVGASVTVRVKDWGFATASPHTVSTAGGTIDGAASLSISADYWSVVLQSDGTDWMIL